MKNIHVLPTDNPSRLIHNDANQLCYQSNKSSKNDRKWMYRKKFNIYITSSEEIKEGDWVLGDFPDKPICKFISKYGEEFTAQSLNGNKHGLSQYDSKKIILTTDQNLIKYGVQSIDDEFLEWFVKNPSCEYVETYSLKEGNEELGYHHYKYEIIIPKEKPKQQTLEEAAERIFGNNFNGMYHDDIDSKMIIMYAIDVAKWQQERMYSEEEVKYMLQSYAEWSIDGDCTYYEWFEQFKKK